MNIIEKLKTFPVLKIIGIVVLGIIGLSIAFSFIGLAFRTAFFGYNTNNVTPSYDKGLYGEMSDGMIAQDKLSARNVDVYQGTTGSDAEDFEVTEYYGDIKTGNLDRVCGEIEDLKVFDYVIFENSNRDNNRCSYSFKVINERTEEILTVIEELKPENLNANTHTIKTVIDDYTSEVEILEKKLASLEQILLDAQNAYDTITVLATRTQDAESLAKIIDSKIKLIERLTTERINIKESIDRLNRSKVEQLDRLKYTFFNLNVSEIKIFDGKMIKDSWIYEAKQFVNDFNKTIQDITINLASYLLNLIKFAIYLLIALFVIKYGWLLVKRIWK